MTDVGCKKYQIKVIHKEKDKSVGKNIAKDSRIHYLIL